MAVSINIFKTFSLKQSMMEMCSTSFSG